MAFFGTWKIQVGPNELANYSDSVQRAPVTGGPVFQNETLLGSAARFRTTRGNWETVRQLTIVKEHSTNKAAVDFYETCVETYAGIYDVLLTHKDYSGVETTYKVAGALVQIETDEPIGVTTISRVTITGGKATEYV